jgi:hypothetical protein
VRKCLANVNVPLAHAVTSRASILSTALPRYAARSIISSGACALGVPSSSVVIPALARSLLDGSGLGWISALCRPLVALRCDPCAGFKLLAELKGRLAASQVRDLLPPETIRQLHKAYSQLFSDLGYLEFDTFCSSLVDLVGLSSRCGRLLDGKVAEFVGTCRSHVSDLVKNHFSSTSNDDKITVSFMSGPWREILTAAGNATSAFVSHVDMGDIAAPAINFNRGDPVSTFYKLAGDEPYRGPMHAVFTSGGARQYCLRVQPQEDRGHHRPLAGRGLPPRAARRQEQQRVPHARQRGARTGRAPARLQGQGFVGAREEAHGRGLPAPAGQRRPGFSRPAEK